MLLEEGGRDLGACGFGEWRWDEAVRAGVDHEAARPVARVGGDESARRAGGPAVLVIEPCAHLELLRLVDAGADTFEPAVGEVGCAEAYAGVHEESADAGVMEKVDLATASFGIEFAVPSPEGRAAEFGGKREKMKTNYHLQK